MIHLETLPDIKRIYLCDRISNEIDPHHHQTLVSLLQGYDLGKIDVIFDPVMGEVRYRVLEMN